LLSDPQPLVRMAALELLDRLSPPARLSAVGPLLSDSTKAVRIAAGRLLADLPVNMFSDNLRASRLLALQEYVQALRLNSDWPEQNVNMGNLYLRQGRIAEAREAYRRAVSLDNRLTAGYVNWADLERQQNNDAEAESVLRLGLKVMPAAADLRHSLGLLLVRKGDKNAAMEELRQAASLAPDNARYLYVYAIALDSIDQRSQAIDQLNAFNARHPDNVDILGALVSLNRAAGNRAQALSYARRLAVLLPGNPAVARLLADLERLQ
jgi:tetratricopeptide (TPR) repeat protein